MEYCRYLDFLSTSPKLKVQGKARFDTLLGKLFGVISITLISTIGLLFLIDVISRDQINILYNVDTNIAPSIDFNSNKLLFLMTDALGQEYKNADRLFTIKAKFWKLTPTAPKANERPTNLDIIDVPVNSCSNTNFSSIDKTYKLIIDIYSSSLCVDFTDKNITIFGRYGGQNSFSMLNFYLNKCVNTTDKTNCLPQEAIDKTLSQTYLNVLFFENNIDTKNIEEPIQTFIKTDIFPYSTSLFKNYFVELNSVIFHSDDGMILKDLKNYKSYKINEIKESADLRGSNTLYPGTFGQFNWRGSGKTEIYYRSFMKFQNAFANLGGIFQMTLILSKILVYFWSKNKMNEFILKNILNREEIKKFKELEDYLKIEDFKERILSKKNLVNNTTNKYSYKNNNINERQKENKKFRINQKNQTVMNNFLENNIEGFQLNEKNNDDSNNNYNTKSIKDKFHDKENDKNNVNNIRHKCKIITDVNQSQINLNNLHNVQNTKIKYDNFLKNREIRKKGDKGNSIIFENESMNDRKDIKFSYIEKICSRNLMCNKKKRKFYVNLETTLNHLMSIECIIQTLLDFENVKRKFITKEQKFQIQLINENNRIINQ